MSARTIKCPICGSHVLIGINAAVSLSAHLEDDHAMPFQQVVGLVVMACKPSAPSAQERER